MKLREAVIVWLVAAACATSAQGHDTCSRYAWLAAATVLYNLAQRVEEPVARAALAEQMARVLAPANTRSVPDQLEEAVQALRAFASGYDPSTGPAEPLGPTLEIQRFLKRSGCGPDLTLRAGTGGEFRRNGAAESGPPEQTAAKAATSGSPSGLLSVLIGIFLIVANCAGVMLATVWLFRRERRSARTAFGAPLKIIEPETEAAIECIALDLGRGGAKLAWNNAPNPGTALTMIVAESAVKARIVWSNAHYAGVAFTPALSEDLWKSALEFANGASKRQSSASGKALPETSQRPV